MQTITILKRKEVNRIKEYLLAEYGCTLKEEYVYLRNQRGNIFLLSPEFQKINLKNLIIDKTGFYFAEEYQHELRLSKEGAQLLAKQANPRTVELTTLEVKQYFQGEDLERELGDVAHFVLLQYQGQVFCCAKYKERKILNFLPKMHRGEVIL